MDEHQDEALWLLAKVTMKLLGEYHTISARIVARHDHNRYVLAADRERLASLNDEVDGIMQMLRASVEAVRKEQEG